MKHKATLTVLVLAAFFLAGCLSVGDRVWLDENGNGIQDEGELGAEGVEVVLFNLSTNAIEDTAITDGNGGYTLSDPFPGTQSFRIIFDLPDGYEFSPQDEGSDDDVDSDADASGFTASLTGEDSATNFDAGLVAEQSDDLTAPEDDLQLALETATIGGYVWVDSNGNGLQDEDEQPLPEVGVDLLLQGGILRQTETDADGLYQFEVVEVDLDYVVRFEPPTEYTITLMDQGSDDDVDSDADPETGESDAFALPVTGAEMDAGAYIPIADVCYGPTAEDIPDGISPLSGLEVSDPNTLQYRPLYLSVSIFPASVRPPTGISVSPQIFEIYIGDGETRLMSAFYGEFPESNYDPGEGEESGAPEGELVIGDRVWFDNNANGIQEEGEFGVPNIPVTLYVNGSTFGETITDGGGYYYFDLSEVDEEEYTVQVYYDLFAVQPDFYFVTRDAGEDDEVDSDASSLGYSHLHQFSNGELDAGAFSLDAGVRQAVEIQGLRSGRVAYQDIQSHYCGCLVTAGADPSVAAQINTCANAFGDGGIGSAGLDVTRLEEIAEQSSQQACGGADLAANLFCTTAPENGQAATELWVEYNINNINHFIFNGEGAYNWYINGTSADSNQDFTLMTDGLTGEELTFENVVVMQVEHSQDNADGTIFSLGMTGQTGVAYYLRGGQLYEGSWTTLASESYDINSEHLPPVRFLDENGDPFAFAPGQMWVNVVNTGDNLRTGAGAGQWEVDFDAPAFSP